MRTAKTYYINNLSEELGRELLFEEFEKLSLSFSDYAKGVNWIGLMVVIIYPNGKTKSGLIEKNYLE